MSFLKNEQNKSVVIDRETFDNKISELIGKAESLIPDKKLPDLPFMELASDVHDWHEHEHLLWEIGEEIRQYVLVSKKQLNDEQIEEIIGICKNSCAGRGRQTFVILLDKCKFNKFANKIVGLLNDDDIDGHIISTLYKMKAYDYADYVKPFLHHKQLWIRKEAKRYMEKCLQNQV